MAFVVPALATLGGGSALAGGVVLASAAAGVASAAATARAGRAADKQAKIDALAEGDAARQREIQRKRALRRALSSQIAESGSAGVAFEGSLARRAELDIAEANDDLLVDTANTRQRQRSLRSQGRAARSTGNLKAGATLLDTAARLGT